MLFNSFHFLVFFPIVLGVYHLIPRRYRWMFLLVASYYFYMSWNPWYLGLIVASTGVDYWAGLKIYKTSEAYLKKRWLCLSITVNLGILFIFKYYNFFIGSFTDLVSSVGWSVSPAFLNLILPVGISFYTFQTISYTVDVYKGRIEPERNLGYFALFVSFFPQLVAGPIERAGDLLPQLKKASEVNLVDIRTGVNQILYGLFKKLVVADRLSIYVDQVYSDVSGASGIVVLIASFFFLIQVYCDFSGYSDIAIGVARLMGYKLTINFSRPFLSTSFREYWQRWHITLSNWVRDYIYISLGGNRVSKARIHLNIVITFVIMGLWHGASWNFVVWGLMHGMLLVLEQSFGVFFSKILSNRRASFLGWVTVMFSFVISMIFFRASSTEDMLHAFESIWHLSTDLSLRDIMFGLNPNDFYLCLAVTGLLALTYLLPRNFKFRFNYAYAFIILILITLLGVNESINFVYFQF